MKKTILLILALLSFAICYAAPKPYTYYRITKVESATGFSLSKDLVESICLKKLIYFSHFDASIHSQDMFKVGGGVRSGQDAFYFEMYPSGAMLINYNQETKVYRKTLDLLYDKKHMPLFPYKGTVDYFTAPSSDIIVKTNINGKFGEVTISIGKSMTIKLKVKESNDWDLSKDKELDIKDLSGDYYPFMVAFKKISGTIQYTNLFLQRQGRNAVVKEPVDIIVAQLKSGELFCLGFSCADPELQDSWGHHSSQISALSREAGFSSPIPISSTNQTIHCKPMGKGTVICGGGTDSISLVINADKRVLMTSPVVYYPYGIHWSSQVVLK